MALFAIPNPKKSTQVDFPIERVKLSVLNISLLNDKYKFTGANEIFNQYTYEALEFLSLGVFIDINLNTVSDSKTEITIEVRRKIGTFNQSHEVTKANDHLVKIFDCIARLTAMTEEQIEALKNQNYLSKSPSYKKTKLMSNPHQLGQNSNPNAWYEKTWLVLILCVLFFPIGLYGLWKNSSVAKGGKIAITVLIVIVVFASLSDHKNASVNSNPSKSQTVNEVIAEEAKPNVEILQQTATYQEAMDSYTIHCRVRNNTKELINYVDVKATFYDKQGTIVGTGMGNAANFAAGAEKTIDVIGIDIQNCDRYEVQVDNVIN